MASLFSSFTIGALRRILQVGMLAGVAAAALAQAAKPAPQAAPPVQVNVINVCTPSPEEQKDIAAVLTRIPTRPAFSADFEITRGRSASPPPDSDLSNWVRMRREFGADAPFTSVQYAVTVDAKGIVETMVFPAKAGGDLVQVVLEDKVTSGTPAAVLSADTPVNRIRVERMGKASRGLARCQDADQAALEPLFTQASDIMRRYRASLRVPSTAGGELSRLGVANAIAPSAPKSAPAAKKK